MSHGKKYATAVATYDKQQTYEPQEAVELVKKLSFAKFDETVELSMNLNLKKSATVRDTLVLPNQFSAQMTISSRRSRTAGWILMLRWPHRT